MDVPVESSILGRFLHHGISHEGGSPTPFEERGPVFFKLPVGDTALATGLGIPLVAKPPGGAAVL